MKKDKTEPEQPEEETVHEIKLVKKPEGEESAKLKIKKKKQKTTKAEEEATMDVVLSLKKPIEQESESETEAEFTMAKVKLKPEDAEDVEAQISLKPKAKAQAVDETAEDLTLTLKPEQPENQQLDVILKKKEQPEEEESADFTIAKPTEGPVAAPEDVSEKLKIKKKKPKKPSAGEDELSITKEIVLEPEPITVEEIVPEQPEPIVEQVEEHEDVTIGKKKKSKVQATEELTEDVTLKTPTEVLILRYCNFNNNLLL